MTLVSEFELPAFYYTDPPLEGEPELGSITGIYGVERPHVDPGVELVPPRIYPDAGVAAGIEGFDAFMRMLTQVWGEWRYEVDGMEEVGERVVVMVTLHAHGRGSGAPTATRGAHLLTFREDRVVRLEVYLDRAEARAAAGLSAGP